MGAGTSQPRKEKGGAAAARCAMPRFISASSLITLARCDRQVYLDHHGDRRLRLPPSAFDEWLNGQGQQFEEQVIAPLRVSEPARRPDQLQEAFQDTLDLMREGAPLIYQGVLIDGDLLGIPDLLKRVEGRSTFGSYHYAPIDIKLTAEVKPEHALQVMFYSALLEAIQGTRPEGSLYLRLPPDERGGEALFHEERVTLDAAALAGKLDELRRLAGGDEPRPFISSVCRSCGWREVCLPIAERAGDVSLVPGLTRRVWHGLHALGLGTLRATAGASAGQLVAVKGVGEKTAETIIAQARALADDRPVHLARPDLPDPSEGDVFFDVESYPVDGVYYLLGVLAWRDGKPIFTADLAERPENEGQMWEAFLRRIDRLNGWVYHYGAYERTAINALMRRYGDDPRGQRLLDRLVDLERVLKNSVVLPLRGYSLKDVAYWLGFRWTGETQAADDSMIQYDAWLRTGQREHLERILRYNEDDLHATAAVRDWLLALRRDAPVSPGEGSR